MPRHSPCDRALKMPAARVTVVVLGPLPPPQHGAARVTAAFADLFGDRPHVALRTFDTSAAGRTGARYHAVRLRTHLYAAVFLASARASGPRVLYVGGAGGWGLLHQLVVVAVAKARGFTVAFHHHSYAYLGRRAAPAAALVRVLGRHDVHIVLCDRMADDLSRRYAPRGRVVTLSNAAFTAIPPPPPARDGAPYAIGHLSNLSAAKGLGQTITAMRRLLAERPDARAALAGPAAAESDRARIDALTREFPGRATYHGALPHEDVAAFLGGLDLFLFPSRYRHEAEPLVVLEALAAGTPVLAYDVGCLGSMGGGVTTVEPSADFAEAVLDAARQSDARHDVAESFAQRRARSRAIADALVDDLVGARS
jgi:glycosyltransferase involved in cell wall biosynthesis